MITPGPRINAPLITIFVRHNVGCKYAGDESAKRCACRKWFRWTQDGTRHRRPANTRSWAEAEQAKRDLEDHLRGKPPEAESTGNKPIGAAIEIFLADKKVTGVTQDVLNKYTRELARLRDYCESQGVYMVAGLTRELLTGYASTWERQYPSTQTRSVVRTRCRGFITYCYQAQWIPRIPSLPKVTVDEVETLPLSHDEYERLLAAADKFKGPAPARLVRALVQLMRWTGLAITDALTLPAARLTNAGGKYRVVTQRTKTGTDVSIVLPPHVGREILSVAVGDYVFWDGAGDIVKSWTKYVMPRLFEAAQIERGGNMMSHRLRDTFACDLLSKGVPIQEVSKLLGHTSVKTTEKSYAKWVQGRQDRLDALVTATWDV